jgi:phage shock protein C
LISTTKEILEGAMADSDELGKLGDLHSRGILSDDEFSRAKARVLNGSAATQWQAPIVHALNGLHRSRDDRWLGGVCGGIGQSTGIAAWLWRLVFTALVLCAGAGVVVYLLMWIFVPLEPARVGVGQAAR